MRRIAMAAFLSLACPGQQPAGTATPSTSYRCRHVLTADGQGFRAAVVTVQGDRITAIDDGGEAGAAVRDLGDGWLIPGLIDLHTHVCLRPYDQLGWNEQVLGESVELRSIRAAAHAEATLRAGFVAIRDLGTEGAGTADVALRQAIAEGSARGPRVFASTRAIVATGCYGPELAGAAVQKGAQVADGPVGVRRAVREQVAAGAEWIKVYADYRRAAGQPSTPTFSLEELQAICDEAHSAGLDVAAHATTDEGIRRAVLAGVRTIEHGSGASDATLQLLRERQVVLCPCLAANEAIVRQAGHRGPIVGRLNAGRLGFQRALAAGVRIACGSDAGVFAHGDNAREIELMVEYGMPPAQALAAATAVAAAVLGQQQLGAIAVGRAPGLVLLDGDPLADPANLRKVRLVIAGGVELPR